MKILIKQKKWNMFIGNMVLVCDIHEENGIFSIVFPYGDQKVFLKSNNIDRTLNYLEKLFLNTETQISQKSA